MSATDTPPQPSVRLSVAERTQAKHAQKPTVPASQWEAIERHLDDVTKPAQYTGIEHNAKFTDWADASTRWLLCYPDAYEVGQPNQGIQILYEVLNERAGTLAERAYAPWHDLEERMRADGIATFSLESHRPLWAFDIFAVTLPHELGHTNLLNLLDLGGVPIRTADRDAADPIVLIGGHAAFNPEPLAPFVDAVVMGDGEEVVGEIDAALTAAKANGNGVITDRAELLRSLAQVEGVYVPSLYEARWTDDGRLRSMVSIDPVAPALVPKRTIQDLEDWQYPKKQIVPVTEVVHERFSVEIFRGCTRGCRFCQAGMITRPVRERLPETVRTMVAEGVKDSGFEEVGLLSLSSADHSGIAGLAKNLADDYEGTTTSLSLPSTRVDAFNVTLSNELSRNGRRTGLTFAPEAGSERMRAVINKMVKEEDLLKTAEVAFSEGWRHIKLYFMVGLPTEEDEDVLAIADLGIKAYEVAKSFGGRNKVTISVGGFVPKPHTPFQWASQDSPEEIRRKLSMIRERISPHSGLTLRTNAPEDGLIEGLLARGDRRIADVVETAWRMGATFDGWHEFETLPIWREAMAAHDYTFEEFCYRERTENEALPWEHLDSGLDKEWLWKDWVDAKAMTGLEDCRWDTCYDCGVCPGLDLMHDTGFGMSPFDKGTAAEGVRSLPIASVGASSASGALPTAAATNLGPRDA